MTNSARIEKLHTQALEGLDLAFQSDDVEAARTALSSSLAAVRTLARLGDINPALVEAVNETKLALASRGWC